MTSVSEVDWKIEPAASSSWRRIVGVDQVAVVADRDRPAVALDEDGCAFAATLSPVVE